MCNAKNIWVFAFLSQRVTFLFTQKGTLVRTVTDLGTLKSDDHHHSKQSLHLQKTNTGEYLRISSFFAADSVRAIYNSPNSCKRPLRPYEVDIRSPLKFETIKIRF